MKKILTLVIAAIAAMGVNAVELSLWSGTATENGVELNATRVASFEVGDVLRISVAASESAGNINVCYKSEAGGWAPHQIPSAVEYPWIEAANNYYEITFTEADITALEGQNIYCYNGSRTLSEIIVIRADLAPGAEKELWSGEVTLAWSEVAKQSDITAALLGEKDTLKVTVSARTTGENKWPKVVLTDKNSASVAESTIPEIQLWNVEDKDLPYTGKFILTEAGVTALQGGFGLTGDLATITKLVLKKYDDTTTTIDSTNANTNAGVKILRDGVMYIRRGETLYNMQGQIVK